MTQKKPFICEDCGEEQELGEPPEICIECGYGPMCQSCADQHECDVLFTTFASGVGGPKEE